jgi:hypothetical protein
MVGNASMMALDQLKSALQNWMQKECNTETFHYSKQVAHQASDLWTME